MVFFLGKRLSDNSTLKYSLIKIFGIGLFHSDKICKNFGFLPKIQVSKITSKNWGDILKYFRHNSIIIEKDLKKKLQLSITKILKLHNYRGLRHYKGLPVRGQRTHSNAKTQKKLFTLRLPKRFFSTRKPIIYDKNNLKYPICLKNKMSYFIINSNLKNSWYLNFIKNFNLYFLNQANVIYSFSKKIKNFNLTKIFKKNKKKINKKFLKIIKTNKLLSQKLNNQNTEVFTNEKKKVWSSILNLISNASFMDSYISTKYKKNFKEKNKSKVYQKIKQIIKKKSYLDRSFHLITPKSNEPLIFIKARFNNFFSFVYDSDGNLLFWSSGGLLKFKGKLQGSRYAGKTVIDFIISKLLDLKIKKVCLLIDGKGAAKRFAVKTLKRKKRKLRITHFFNIAKIPFNGTKKKKKKR